MPHKDVGRSRASMPPRHLPILGGGNVTHRDVGNAERLEEQSLPGSVRNMNLPAMRRHKRAIRGVALLTQ